jgi:hypothetical protein
MADGDDRVGGDRFRLDPYCFGFSGLFFWV